ncbi:hypothetical protein [Pontibacter rugosus]|uniref:Uncharacterized protein n=1 Tax=Pontibacter rugosus TaxID=1745966 RepID=A0ABW3SJW9_9BACT
MATTKPTRLPHGWNAELQKRTGYSQPLVTSVIHNGEVDHEVWKAYEQLLAEKLQAKKSSESQKQQRLAKAEQMRRELAA